MLLLDLHLAEAREPNPIFVKSQLKFVSHVLAISFANDGEAKALAESYGAVALLDKMNLYHDMIPAIMACMKCPGADKKAIPKTSDHVLNDLVCLCPMRSQGKINWKREHRPTGVSSLTGCFVVHVSRIVSGPISHQYGPRHGQKRLLAC